MIFAGDGALLKHALTFTMSGGYPIDLVCCPTTELEPFLTRNHIPFRIVRDINAMAAEISSCCSDGIIFSINNNWIFRKELLEIEGIRIYNIHNGILPFYRGVPAACIIFAILNGEIEYGASLHRVDEGIDTGRCIGIRKFPILPSDGFEQVMVKGIECCRDIFCEHLAQIVKNSYEYLPARGGISRLYRMKDLETLHRYREHPEIGRATRLGIFKLWYKQASETIRKETV